MSYLTNPYRYVTDDCTYRSAPNFPNFGSTAWVTTGDFAVSTIMEANCDVGHSNNGSSAYLDLGASFVSNTEWVLRWEWRVDAWQGTATSGNATVSFGLYSDYPSAGSDSAGDGTYSSEQEAALIFLANAGGSGGGSATYFQSLATKGMNTYYNGDSLNPKRANLLENFSPAIYYMTIQRFSDDTIDFTYSGNSDYVSAPTASYSLTDTEWLPSDNSLRYLKSEAWQMDTYTASGVDSSIYNITFANDSSEACS